MLGVHQIAQGNERGAAICRVCRAFSERSARDPRFAAFEHFIRFDVATLTIKIRAALYEVPSGAGRQHSETRRYTRYEYDALDHLLKDSDGFGAKLAQH